MKFSGLVIFGFFVSLLGFTAGADEIDWELENIGPDSIVTYSESERAFLIETPPGGPEGDTSYAMIKIDGSFQSLGEKEFFARNLGSSVKPQSSFYLNAKILEDLNRGETLGLLSMPKGKLIEALQSASEKFWENVGPRGTMPGGSFSLIKIQNDERNLYAYLVTAAIPAEGPTVAYFQFYDLFSGRFIGERLTLEDSLTEINDIQIGKDFIKVMDGETSYYSLEDGSKFGFLSGLFGKDPKTDTFSAVDFILRDPSWALLPVSEDSALLIQDAEIQFVNPSTLNPATPLELVFVSKNVRPYYGNDQAFIYGAQSQGRKVNLVTSSTAGFFLIFE